MKRIAELTLIFALIALAVIPVAVSCEDGLVPSPAQTATTAPQSSDPASDVAATPSATTGTTEAPPAADTIPATDSTPATDTAPAANTTPTVGTTPATDTSPSADTAPAVEPPKEPAVMTELGVELVSITPEIHADAVVEITIRTVPGATVFLQPVNPSTGTRSAWPKSADGGKIRISDEKGMATWSWIVHERVIPGPGTLEFLATTSTDTDYIGKWKATMTRRSMNRFTERDDTVLVEIPWTIRP